MKRLIALIICAVALWCCTACTYSHRPPANDTPEPAAHNGIYTFGDNALTFNGDGQTLEWLLTKRTSERTGLPERGRGWYAFKFWHGKCRYDDATSFQMGTDSASCEFSLVGKADSVHIFLSTRSEEPDTLYFQNKGNKR